MSNKISSDNDKYPTTHEEIVKDRSTSTRALTPQNDSLVTNATANLSCQNNESILKKWWRDMMGDIYATDNDPYQFSQARKNLIVFIIAYSGLMGPVGAMIYMPGMIDVMRDMNTSLAGLNGSVAIYIVFMGISPLFWASMSDVYGRKPVYMLSITISIIAACICAVSKNIAMLIIFRALQACGTGAGQTLGAGVIADIFEVAHRGKAYGIFYIGPLFGPALGPTIGGVLCHFLGWKSTFYFLAILGAVLLLMITFLLPETLRRSKAVDDQNQEVKVTKLHIQVFKKISSAFHPMILMLGDPTVLVITIYNSVIFACMFFLTPTISDNFQTAYHYNSWQIGLCYLVFGVGLMSGSVLSGQYTDFVMKRLRKSNGVENVYPELRLRATFPSFVLIPVGYLIYGWTSQKAVGVYAPFIGLFVYALGQMSAFTPTSVYLVDSKPGRSASAVAINNFVRSIFAAAATIISTSCLRAVGPGILFSILAGINLVNIILVLLVLVYGKKWRTNFEKRTGGVVQPITKA